MNKMSELRERVIVEDYELTGITETWATESVNDAELSMEGYNMFRKDRGTRGGGLILYIKNNLRARINEDLTNSEFAESLWCDVEADRQRALIGLCYRSPTSTTENDENLLSVMEKAVLRTAANHILIMGDFNFPEIDYASESVVGRDTEPPAMFLFKTQELCLSQHVKDATRIRQNQTPTTLDYIFTEEENLIETINYEVPLGKSDHVVLTWKLLLATSSVPSNQVKYNNTIKGTIAVSRVVCR